MKKLIIAAGRLVGASPPAHTGGFKGGTRGKNNGGGYILP